MSFVLVFLWFYFFCILFYKWNGPEALANKGGIFKKMSACEFCMEFWLSFLLTGLIAILYSPAIFAYTPALPALSNIIKRIS